MTRLKIANLGSLGIIKDSFAEDIPPEAFTDGRNVRFTSQGARAFNGHRAVFQAATVEPLWLSPFPPIANPTWVYYGDGDMYAWDGVHTKITRTLLQGGSYQAGLAERWQGFLFNNVGIFNNSIDFPQLWTPMNSLTKLVNLPNWPSGNNLRARFMRPYRNFLICGYMIESGIERPFRIRWSDAAAPGTVPGNWDIVNPASLGGEFDLAETPDYCIDGLALGEIFVVYKERSAWAMQLVGGNQIFNTWQIVYDRGILWRDCAQIFPGGHLVVGQDDIYVHQGQRGSDRSVVQDRLRRWIFRQIDDIGVVNCHTALNREETEVWFCFPEAGETRCTLVAVWNWVTGGVGIRDLPKAPYVSSGVVDELTELDIWGSNELTVSGALRAQSARMAGTGKRVVKTTGAALISLHAVMSSSGDSGVPGWPPFTNPLYFFTGTISANVGPLQLSLLSLTNEAGDVNARYYNQPSRITLNFGPGVIIGGDYNGSPERIQPALLLDKLQPASVIYVNLNGGAILGGGGNGGKGGNFSGRPIYSNQWGQAGQPGFPAIVADAQAYIKVTGGDVRGGRGGGGGGGWITTQPGGGGGGGVGGRSGVGFGRGGSSILPAAAGTDATSPANYTLAAPGVGYTGALAQDSGDGASWTGSAGAGSEGTNPGAAGGNGYSFCTLPSGDILLVSATETGSRQSFGSLTASLAANSLVATVPNGAQYLGSILVDFTGAANDLFVRLDPVRAAGDPNITAEWARPVSQTRHIYFTSTGTDRVREAVFQIILTDAANRQAIVGFVSVSVTHGSPTYIVSVSPNAVDVTFAGTGVPGFSHTFSQQFTATVGGGVGPFSYQWDTTVGTIISGQGSPVVTVETVSSSLSPGQSTTMQGHLTLTVLDSGNGNDQLIEVTSIKYVVNNGTPSVVHDAAGALTAGRATLVGVGAVTHLAPIVLNISPSSVAQTSFQPGTSFATVNFFQTLSVAISGGAGPFLYQWTTTLVGGTFTDDTVPDTFLSISVSAPPGSFGVKTGGITITVTDVGNGNAQTALTIAAQFLVNNP